MRESAHPHLRPRVRTRWPVARPARQLADSAALALLGSQAGRGISRYSPVDAPAPAISGPSAAWRATPRHARAARFGNFHGADAALDVGVEERCRKRETEWGFNIPFAMVCRSCPRRAPSKTAVCTRRFFGYIATADGVRICSLAAALGPAGQAVPWTKCMLSTPAI